MEKNYYIFFKSKLRFVFVVMCFGYYHSFAQKPNDTAYVRQLPATDIISKNYIISETGIKNTTPDSALKYINNYKDLSDIINLNSTASLKNYGNGSLATVSFRGTGAEHTNVLWNGFQLNSPAWGLTDLSNLTSNSSEKITMLVGGNATSAGSGSIGGTVMIDQGFDKKDLVNYSGNYNSIGGYTTAFNTNMNSKKLLVNLGVVYRDNSNHFEYINPFKAGMPKEFMPKCSINKVTFNGSALYKINKNISLKILSLINTYHIAIQPPIGIDLIQGKRIGYNMVNGIHLDFKTNWGITQFKTGLLNQDETYDAKGVNNTFSKTTITQWQNSLEHFFKPLLTRHIEHKVSIGLEYQYIKGEQNNYTTIHRENRSALMLRYKVNPIKRLQLTANIREQFYTSIVSSAAQTLFSPFIGLQYIIVQQRNSNLLFKTNATKGFRLPTFNERYYQPGGNVNIEPENTRQFEAGLLYKWSGKKVKQDIEFTYYYNHMFNRVVWLNVNPTYVEPINLKETKINGLELVYNISTKIKQIEIKSQVNAGYTNSLNIIHTSINKQMIYIPPFKMNWWMELKYKKISLIYILQQTGTRYTNLDNTDWLQPYVIQNVYVQRTFKLKQLDFMGSLKAINIGNVYYQTLQNYALPGRYFEVSIIINIKQSFGSAQDDTLRQAHVKKIK